MTFDRHETNQRAKHVIQGSWHPSGIGRLSEPVGPHQQSPSWLFGIVAHRQSSMSHNLKPAPNEINGCNWQGSCNPRHEWVQHQTHIRSHIIYEANYGGVGEISIKPPFILFRSTFTKKAGHFLCGISLIFTSADWLIATTHFFAWISTVNMCEVQLLFTLYTFWHGV